MWRWDAKHFHALVWFWSNLRYQEGGSTSSWALTLAYTASTGMVPNSTRCQRPQTMQVQSEIFQRMRRRLTALTKGPLHPGVRTTATTINHLVPLGLPLTTGIEGYTAVLPHWDIVIRGIRPSLRRISPNQPIPGGAT